MPNIANPASRVNTRAAVARAYHIGARFGRVLLLAIDGVIPDERAVRACAVLAYRVAASMYRVASAIDTARVSHPPGSGRIRADDPRLQLPDEELCRLLDTQGNDLVPDWADPAFLSLTIRTWVPRYGPSITIGHILRIVWALDALGEVVEVQA